MENGTDIESVMVKCEPVEPESDSDNEALIHYASRVSNSDDEALIHYATRVKTEHELQYPVKIEPLIKIEIEEVTPDIGCFLATQLEEPDGRTNERTDGQTVDGEHGCDICGRRYKNKQGLSAHKKRIHFQPAIMRSKRDGKCEYCHKKYVNRKSLLKHMNKMHLLNNGVGYQFRCEDCGKVLRSRSSLWMHRYHHHSNLDLRRPCEHCARVLKTPRSLRDHILKKHPREYLSKNGATLPEEEAIVKARPFQCKLCERRYTSHSILKKHISSVHPPPEESRRCPVCFRRFKTEFRLVSHLETAHSDAAALRKCTHCSQLYKNKYSLQQHVKYAHGVRESLRSGRACTDQEVLGYTRKPHALPVPQALAVDLVRRLSQESDPGMDHGSFILP